MSTPLTPEAAPYLFGKGMRCDNKERLVGKVFREVSVNVHMPCGKTKRPIETALQECRMRWDAMQIEVGMELVFAWNDDGAMRWTVRSMV